MSDNTINHEAAEQAAENETATVMDGAAGDAVQQEKKEKKGSSKKLAEALAERDDFKDKYQRTFSEFNNYRKRTASTRADAFQDGQCDAISRILPVLDNFERALEHVEEGDAVAQGFKMIYKQLNAAVEQMGVAEMGAPGDVFDPTLHQAIQMVDPKDGECSGTVAGVAQKGYKMEDRVIRHCMVMVNK